MLTPLTAAIEAKNKEAFILRLFSENYVTIKLIADELAYEEAKVLAKKLLIWFHAIDDLRGFGYVMTLSFKSYFEEESMRREIKVVQFIHTVLKTKFDLYGGVSNSYLSNIS